MFICRTFDRWNVFHEIECKTPEDWCCCEENPYAVPEFPLHHLNLRIWCVVSGFRIIGPVLIEGNISSYRKFTLKVKTLQLSETSVIIDLPSLRKTEKTLIF